MKKSVSILLIVSIITSLLSSCAVPPEDRPMGGREALERITAIRNAEELYVGVSENHYLDDEYTSKIENSAYIKKNMQVMWHYEDGTTAGEHESYIRKIGKAENSYGDYDFKGEYGANDYANNFVKENADSMINLLQSDAFDSYENKYGFVLECKDEKALERNNTFIYDVTDGENTLADMLGGNIFYSLTVEFIKNDYDGLNVVSTTTIAGSDHVIEVVRITQFMLGGSGLDNIKQEIVDMKF